ncbi:MAG: hypothetical protein AAFQ66_20085 [Pseudomonadota bacterium]
MSHLSLLCAVPLALCVTPILAQDAEDRLAQIATYFANANLVAGPDLVDCTLSQGSQTECFTITVKTSPLSYTPGPWCPRSIDDGKEAGGIWLNNGAVHDVDGAFIQNLASFYGDTNWQLFDPETGKVRFTGTLEACQAAARPDVDPEYQNYCVECLPEYMPDDATNTFVIPLSPHDSPQPSDNRFSGSGVTFDGVRLDAPAPVGDILGAYTLAPFDDCGGHVNLHVGYHIHAVTDCHGNSELTYGPQDSSAPTGHGNQVGIAMDGYQIFTHLASDGTAPTDLDQCNGHASDALGYHYHAGAPGSNAILGCLTAEAGCVLNDANETCDASRRPRRP